MKELIIKVFKTTTYLRVVVYENKGIKYSQQVKRVKRNKKKYRYNIKKIIDINFGFDPIIARNLKSNLWSYTNNSIPHDFPFVNDLKEIMGNRNLVILTMQKEYYLFHADFMTKKIKSLWQKIINGYDIVSVKERFI